MATHQSRLGKLPEGARERHRVPQPAVPSHQVADSEKHLLASGKDTWKWCKQVEDLPQGATGRHTLPTPPVTGDLDSESPFELSRSKIQETWQRCNQHSEAVNALLRCQPH
jgi:hypothetical protein